VWWVVLSWGGAIGNVAVIRGHCGEANLVNQYSVSSDLHAFNAFFEYLA
jgi:hypothetical protein